ncbi:MAG: T9SS type A sorting domain-containing protein [Parabacteroides sp.]|nr:T9SS type A sorting domain-containing protein [Parabacteroides sp.]
MKKNLLLTFFLLCVLPLTVFAVEDPVAVTVTITQPTNSVVEVAYTPFGTTTATTKIFMDVDGYDGTISIESGASVNVKVIPISTYAFDKIVINEADPILENDYLIEDVTEATTITTSVVRMYTFTITKPVKCDFEVEYMPAPLESRVLVTKTFTPDEEGDVTLKVKAGSKFSFKVTPDEGYALELIEALNEAITDNPYVVTPVNADKTIKAKITKTHTVTIDKPQNSTVLVKYVEPLGAASKEKTLSGVGDYNGVIVVKDGTLLSVTVNPATGYEFSKTEVNAEVSDVNPTTISPVTKDLQISTEVVKKKYAITITPPSNGTITVMDGDTELESGDLVEHGTQLTVTTTQQDNYELTSLTVNNEELTTSLYTVTGPVTIQAVFTYVAPKYVVTITQPSNGEIVVRRKVVTSTTEAYVKVLSGSEITEGTTLYVDVNPAENFIVNSLKVNGSKVADLTSLPYSFVISSQTMIQAELEIAQQKIIFADVQNGSFIVKSGTKFLNSGDLVNRGTVLTLQAIPSKEYKFKQWWDGDINAEREIVVSKVDITVSAEFALITGIEELYTGMSVYAADGAIYLNGVTEDVTSVSIIDMAGKIVYNSKPEFGQTVLSPVNRGVYVVLVKGTKGNVSTKVIVK